MPCTINLREAFILKRQNIIKYFGVFYLKQKISNKYGKEFCRIKKIVTFAFPLKKGLFLEIKRE